MRAPCIDVTSRDVAETGSRPLSGGRACTAREHRQHLVGEPIAVVVIESCEGHRRTRLRRREAGSCQLAVARSFDQRGFMEPPRRVALEIWPLLVDRWIRHPKEGLELGAGPHALALSEMVERGSRQPASRGASGHDALDELLGKADLVRLHVVGEPLGPAENPVR